MRLLPYLILAYVAVALQIGLGSLLAFGGSAPNFVLLAAIFIALQAPREAALLGCFGLGLIHDLVSQQPLGLYALAYGLVALMIVGSQSSLQRENPVAHLMLAAVGGIVVTLVILVNQRSAPAGPAVQVSPDVTLPAIRVGPGALIWGVVWTTLLAPVVLWPMNKLRKRFAFDHSRWRN